MNPTNTNGAIFGYEVSYDSRAFFRYWHGWQLYTGKIGATYAFDYPAGSEISLNVNFTTGIILLNGEQVSAMARWPYTWGWGWCIGDCAYSADGTVPWDNYRNKMRLYSFKLWNNGKPVYDLQPMIDGMGKYWMLNKVDGTLLTRYEQA